MCSSDLLVGIGQLVLTEPAAWSNWPRVVDKLLQASDAAKIKKLMEGAVLESLHTWISYGKDRRDLVGVLRELGLSLLAGIFKSIFDDSRQFLMNH